MSTSENCFLGSKTCKKVVFPTPHSMFAVYVLDDVFGIKPLRKVYLFFYNKNKLPLFDRTYEIFVYINTFFKSFLSAYNIRGVSVDVDVYVSVSICKKLDEQLNLHCYV